MRNGAPFGKGGERPMHLEAETNPQRGGFARNHHNRAKPPRSVNLADIVRQPDR
jgi:hypothetical protein